MRKSFPLWYYRRNMEAYRSGHNGPDSKIFEKVSVLSAKNPVFLRAPAVRKTEYFAVLSVSSFQKFWEWFSDWHMESCPSGRRSSTRNHVICAKNWIFSKWRRIEAVITSSTRNRVVRKGTWVRIPPLPPKTIPRKSRVYAGFLMSFCGWFCPAENRQIRVNGACGALICGALRQTSYTSYS